jgi:DNA polymerase I-like protein with 3'-5' exonuclease and polymerase domains
MKLISTYIDVIPALARHWPDGRIRYSLNPVGTETGRFSSGGSFKFLDEEENPVEMASINSQNIPSKGNGKITRMLFEAKKEFNAVEVDQDRIIIQEVSEIETTEGWKYGKDIVALKDCLITDEGPAVIESVNYSVLNKEYEFIVRKL